MATKAKSTAVVNYEEQMRRDIAMLGERTAPGGGDKIRITRDKKFKMPDGATSPGPLSVIVLDFVTGHFFYDRPYKEGEVAPPACFGLGTDPRKMVPSENSPDKQADDCQACPNNAFGSKGAGKACTNKRILAVVDPTLENDSILLLDVSPTGTKAWDSYVASIGATLGKMPYGVITDVTFDPNKDFQTLRFGNPQPLPASLLPKAMGMLSAARARLMTEPDVSQYEAPGKKAKKK